MQTVITCKSMDSKAKRAPTPELPATVPFIYHVGRGGGSVYVCVRVAKKFSPDTGNADASYQDRPPRPWHEPVCARRMTGDIGSENSHAPSLS